MSHTNHFIDDDLREPERARIAIFELETFAVALRRAIEALKTVDHISAVIPRYLFVGRFTAIAIEALQYVLRLVVEELTTRRRWVPDSPETTSAAIASAWGEDLLTNQRQPAFGVHLRRNSDHRAYGPRPLSPLAELEVLFAERAKKDRAESTRTQIDVDSFGVGGGGPYGGGD